MFTATATGVGTEDLEEAFAALNIGELSKLWEFPVSFLLPLYCVWYTFLSARYVRVLGWFVCLSGDMCHSLL